MKKLMEFIQSELVRIAGPKVGNKKIKFVLDAEFEAQAEAFFKTKADNVYRLIGTMNKAPQDAKPIERFLSFHEFMNP